MVRYNTGLRTSPPSAADNSPVTQVGSVRSSNVLTNGLEVCFQDTFKVIEQCLHPLHKSHVCQKSHVEQKGKSSFDCDFQY